MLEWKNCLPYLKCILENEEGDVQFYERISGIKDDHFGIFKGETGYLLSLFEYLGTEDETLAIEDYVDFSLEHNMPYLYLNHRMSCIFKSLLSHLTELEELKNIPRANSFFSAVEVKVAKIYYKGYISKLLAKNHLRLAHLSHLVEKHLMVHYQHHLEWMVVLLSTLDGSAREGLHFELDHNSCSFGKWLHDPTLPYINNTSHFADVKNMHVVLHNIGNEIMSIYKKGGDSDYTKLINLLEGLDYRSLEIGNEIAIINDMIVIGEYSKDPMTGLLGRRLFDKIVVNQLEIAKATESNCAMIMCDLDSFKSINDTYGHLTGDEVIKDFANLLSTKLRRSDYIFRFGGEEFFVVLPSTERIDAWGLASQICMETRSRTVVHNGNEINYTVSIGVTGIDINNVLFITKETIEKYVQETDTRLYLAKKNGRNRVE